MKTIVTLTSILLALSASAIEIGTDSKGIYTLGPLGYSDPFMTSQGVSLSIKESIAGTTELSVSSLQLKKLAFRVTNDSMEFLQNGEMTSLLSNFVKNIQSQNKEISETEAVEIILFFADKHI